ncbi:MAG: hypothetical protein ABIQ16_04355 [Polyangiaceae bacterium]
MSTIKCILVATNFGARPPHAWEPALKMAEGLAFLTCGRLS